MCQIIIWHGYRPGFNKRGWKNIKRSETEVQKYNKSHKNRKANEVNRFDILLTLCKQRILVWQKHILKINYKVCDWKEKSLKDIQEGRTDLEILWDFPDWVKNILKSRISVFLPLACSTCDPMSGEQWMDVPHLSNAALCSQAGSLLPSPIVWKEMQGCMPVGSSLVKPKPSLALAIDTGNWVLSPFW